MKQIEVVAAIIHDDEDCIFATQRGYCDMKDGWEFPDTKGAGTSVPSQNYKQILKYISFLGYSDKQILYGYDVQTKELINKIMSL